MADGSKRRDWRGAAATSAQGGPSKSSSVFVAALTAAALVAVIGSLLYYLLARRDPPVRFVSFPLHGYSESWPPVPFAVEDATRLSNHFADGQLNFNTREANRFEQLLTGLNELNDRPLVLYFTGIAAGQGNGLYLLTSEATPGTRNESWHALESVLNAVERSRAADKLLILDISHAVADPKRGILANDAAARLDALLQNRVTDKKLPFLVMTACGPGETSQIFDEQRGTAFAYFVNEALLGHADANRDAWVTVREMYLHVRDRVGRWSQFARNAAQTVRLYGDGDFRLTFHRGIGGAADTEDSSAKAEEKPAAKPDEKAKNDDPVTALLKRDDKDLPAPRWMIQSWQERDQWNRESERIGATWPLRQLERAIVRAQVQWRAGIAENAIRADFGSATTASRAAWEKLKEVRPPRRLFLSQGPNEILFNQLRKWQEESDKAQLQPEPKPKPGEELPAAWKLLVERPLSRKKTEDLCSFALGDGKLEFCEAVFLVKLKKLSREQTYTGDKQRVWRSDTIQIAAKAEKAFLEALAAVDSAPEGLHWLQSKLEDLVKSRAEAEADLWSLGDENSPASAANRAASKFAAIAENAEKILVDAQKYGKAHRAMIEACLDLPAIAEVLGRLDSSVLPEASAFWSRCCDATKRLVEIFDQRDAPIESAITAQTSAMNAALPRLRELINQLSPDGRYFSAMIAAPRLSAERRIEWWTCWQQWKKDRQWVAEKVPAAGEGPASSDAWKSEEAEKARRRARMAIDLGRLAGHDVSQIETEWSDLKNRSDLAAWNALALKLLPLYAAPPSDNSRAAERASRVFGTTDAADRRLARNRANYWEWSAKRLTEESDHRQMQTDSFYLDSIRQAKDAARQIRNAIGS